MWSENPTEFITKCGITRRQAKDLQCTGEHLEAHKDGGTVVQSNIAAACRICNQGRHRRKVAPSPDSYKQLVSSRMAKKRWHQPWVFQKLLPAFQVD
ncbi:HNH endonuclease [Sulfurirhabdus autotrophica]